MSVSSIYAAKAKVHAARCERSVTCMVADAGLAAMVRMVVGCMRLEVLSLVC